MTDLSNSLILNSEYLILKTDMPKKTTILIIILAIITGILIFLAVRSDRSLEEGKAPIAATTPTPVVTKPYADLSFSIDPLDVSKSTTTQSIDILVDTNNKPVSGAQVELSYDPKVLTNVTLTPPLQNPFFGASPEILINSVDPTQGRISYAVAIANNDSQKTGKGIVATLNFTVNKFAGVPFTQITFLPKSAVTAFSSQASVLNRSTPLQIIVSNAPTAQPLAQ